jgi:hypothetical protein
VREDQIDQAERRTVLENDRRVREQQKPSEASTYLDQYHSDVGGRFSVTEHESVTGRVSPKPPQLPAASPWSGSQPEPPIEPPLGISVSDLESSMAPPISVEVTGGAAGAPLSPSSVEHAASPSSSPIDDPAGVHLASPPDMFMPNVDAGSSSNTDDGNA